MSETSHVERYTMIQFTALLKIWITDNAIDITVDNIDLSFILLSNQTKSLLISINKNTLCFDINKIRILNISYYYLYFRKFNFSYDVYISRHF